jgi:hypothetical protein
MPKIPYKVDIEDQFTKLARLRNKKTNRELNVLLE